MRTPIACTLALLLGATVALVSFAPDAAAAPARRLRDHHGGSPAHAAARAPVAHPMKTAHPGGGERSRGKARAPHRARPVRARIPREQEDAFANELHLSPGLLMQLQSNLVEGGYLAGGCDGRLSLRTRKALVAFQREYHLRPTGRVDLPTADALLGRDVVASFTSDRAPVRRQ